MAQLMPLPLTVSCFNKIQIGFTFLVLANPGSPGKGPLNGCVCVCVCVLVANLPVSLQVKEFWKSVNIWGSYGQEFGVLFFETV